MRNLLTAAILVTASVSNAALAANPVFHTTANVSAWTVATTVGGVDGAFDSFPKSGFVSPVAVTNPVRTSEGTGWIANTDSGSNGNFLENRTFFVFRQAFDLSGFNASTANLKFRWAADDSGEGFGSRGVWTPKFRLNGGGLVAGSWPTAWTYDLGNVTTLSSGFVSGVNTLEFFVEGNGVTDGFALETVSFTAAPVPEPETYALLLAGLGMVGVATRRRAVAAA